MITLTREEAQQVLDAFAWELGGEPIGTEIQKSVDLLRARLAQPEPPWINNTHTGNFFNVAQPEPEPVAWDNCVAGLAEARLCKSWCGNFNCSATEPQRKEWQGLTDEEMDSAYRQTFKLIDSRLVGDQIEFVRAIEAKLKEKNT